MKIVKHLFSNFNTGLVTVFLGLFAFGQLQRWQLTNNIAFYAHDLVIICYLIWRAVTAKGLKINLTKLTKNYRLELSFIGWILLGMVAGVLGNRLEFSALLYLLRLIAYLTFSWLVIQDDNLKISPKKGLVVAGSLMASWGLLQYIFLPDTRFLYLYGWDNHYYRLIGTLLDPAFMGMVLVMTWGLWQTPKLFKLPGWLTNIFNLGILIAIAATFSRASYLSWLVLAGLLVINHTTKLKTVLLGGLILVATLLLLPKPGGEGVNLTRLSTVDARYQNSQQQLIKLKGYEWLWGRGLFNTDARGDYETPNHAQLPDSLPVLILNSTGLVGLMLAMVVGDKWFKKWWQQDPLWTSIFIAVLIHSLFNNTFLQPFVLLMLWGSRSATLKKQ